MSATDGRRIKEDTRFSPTTYSFLTKEAFRGLQRNTETRNGLHSEHNYTSQRHRAKNHYRALRDTTSSGHCSRTKTDLTLDTSHY